MFLNIDLGSLYVKVSVVDEDKKRLVTSEVVKVAKTGKGSLETLLTSIVNNYSKLYDIKRVYLIPSPTHIECELIDYEPILEEKYEKMMKSEIQKARKEEKKRERMGEEYEAPSTSKTKNKYEPVNFGYSLTGVEVFHTVEYSDLLSSRLYIEYIDSDYLRTIASITSLIKSKDVRIISPLRLMKTLPFPKRNRIVVNYGHHSVMTAVIKVTADGKEYFEEILNEKIADDGKLEVSELRDKHDSRTLNEDPIYRTKINDIRNLKEKYGYEVYTVGGNSTYIQNDLFFRNKFKDNLNIPQIPLTLENLILPTVFTSYDDFQYNNLQLNLKNRIVNVSTLSTQATQSLLDVGGDLAIAALIVAMLFSYGVNSEYLYYNNQIKSLETVQISYKGDGTNKGKITELTELLDATVNGKTKTYYNVAELLKTLAAPIEIESIKVEGTKLEIVAYSDNVALVRQFLETVKARQLTNDFTHLSLTEKDIATVYRNGQKLDRVVFEGQIY